MLYFAYGSNMDEEAMRLRCPRSRALGLAELKRHRFYLMGKTGYASVGRDPRANVHGVLFDLALADLPALDRYEDVDHGLYTKAHQPVVRAAGSACRALVYLGSDRSENGRPPTGYMEAVAAAGRRAGLPGAYLAQLQSLVPPGGGAARAWR